MTDRRTGSVGADVDLKRTLPALQRQTGGVGAVVDLKRTLPALLRQTGAVGLMVDGLYATSVTPVNATRWSSVAFEMGTASPLTYWSGTQFTSSGSKPTVWVTDHFEVGP